MIGFGVAGNFTGHLDQAGEARDFAHLTLTREWPRGIFPFYVEGHPGQLGVFPVSSDVLVAPDGENVQLEPELGLICHLEWDEERVVAVRPVRFGAFDDASIRRPNAKKISEKKNWGPGSKGYAPVTLDLDRFSADSALADYRIACFLLRDGELHAYGVDSEIASYTAVWEPLLAWIVDRLAEQTDDGPLESFGDHLRHRPSEALISIGATRYTTFGESTFVKPGDEAIVAVYHRDITDLEARLTRRDDVAPRLSVLRRRVVR
jgi:hypothetical protein